jgi:MtfA peptidase
MAKPSLLTWLLSLPARLGLAPRAIPDALWRETLADHPFLSALPAADQQALRALAGRFLRQKQFSGAHGLEVTDRMALAIAAQACLPVLRLRSGLSYYGDFRGIVVHPGAMVARREVTDAAGVVHRYTEVLSGEAMDRGPVTLSWEDASASEARNARGHNVVIHEFIHKIDMRDGGVNGSPPLPSRAARAHWQAVMLPAYQHFREQVLMAERFGAEPPWLDAYGATSPVEFFAVAGEAYFVNRDRFAQDFGPVAALFDGYFGRSAAD